ncbi:MAG: TRAP transporter large permease subunit, partial [Oscillospiraceae bacterium]|nr:TRAP transporter large permease subunit [Oscillospiraceae bacterium]
PFRCGFPGTAGRSIGAAAVIIYALFKRIPIKKIGKAAWEGGHIFAGIYPIIIAGTIFSRLVTLSGLPNFLISFFESANIAPWMVYLLVLVYFVFCGCVMDIVATIVISVPIVFPLLVDSYGYDPFVLIIVLVIVSSTAAITPPIGMGVFTVSNATGISPKEIFAGTTPFVIMYILVAALLIFVPQLVTWLPSLMGMLS